MNIKTLLFAGAMVAMVMSGNSLAQDCVSCAPACGSADCGAVSGFGYSQGCNTCGNTQGRCNCMQHLKDRWGHLKHSNHKVIARNRAWPKPFDCADRQLYFSFWEPMLDAGYQKHTTLTFAHFDAETHELNQYGKSAVAGIMRNLPRHRKSIFIHRDVDQQLSDARMNAVRNAIDTWYGPDSAASIAFTDQLPMQSAGERTEIINRLYSEGTPPPLLPVATGSGGLGTSN